MTDNDDGCLPACAETERFVQEAVLPYMFVKGKAMPLQAWTGPEGSRRLMLPDFKTIGT